MNPQSAGASASASPRNQLARNDAARVPEVATSSGLLFA